ncbi:MAG: NAD(P)/FAD-dependent oxidoreductase [Marinifilaceae bacterium]
MPENNAKKHIVIIGAGFAGLKLANQIKHSNLDITILDRHNYHEFAPLFYQIASCGLEPGAICFPIRRELSKYSNVRFKLGELQGIDIERRTVIANDEEIDYDVLVLATGVVTRFFGMKDVETHALTLKTTAEGLLMRNQILMCLEKAAHCPDATARKRMLTFVVSGGGPAGVEISGALGEMKRYVIPREYPDINPDEVRIILIEAADGVLRTMSDNASRKAAQFLQELEVTAMLGTSITSYDGNAVTTNHGDKIETTTLIWTAGVEGVKYNGLQMEDFGPGNRLLVDEYNALKNHKNIYAIGDCSLMLSETLPKGHPQVAQVAIQQAENLAHTLLHPESKHAFQYHDKGSMATIGRNRAVVDLKHMKMAGRMAWLIWLFIHLISLMGIRNKLVTLINWTWNYFSFNTSLRLLISPAPRKEIPTPDCSGPCTPKPNN